MFETQNKVHICFIIVVFVPAGAASYVTPYTYATLPQTAGLPTAAAGGFPGLSPYQTAAQATLQEARMQ